MTAGPTASQMAAQAMTEKAVESGKVSAADVAQLTFDAIRAGQFYIYSHPQALGGVRERMDEIVQGRNPPDPYAATPHVRDMLQDGPEVPRQRLAHCVRPDLSPGTDDALVQLGAAPFSYSFTTVDVRVPYPGVSMHTADSTRSRSSDTPVSGSRMSGARVVSASISK